MMIGALLLGVALGCGGSQVVKVAPAPSITMLDPGAEPRQQLRYVLTARAPERMEMTSKLRMKSAITNTVLETQHRNVDFPSETEVGRIEVTSLTPGGDAVVSFEVEDVSVLDDVVDPAVRSAALAAAGSTKGLRASWRMTPSGLISNVVVEARNASSSLRELLPSITESLHAAAVVFPDEAIGIGARWQVISQQVSGTVTWNRTVTYQLKALTDSMATIDAQMVMHAPSQALSVEPNSTTRLTSGTSNATAEVVIPLRGLVPTLTNQGTTELNFSIASSHLRIISTVQMETLSSVKPVAGTATP
ncbi:MAG: hypothetical protein JWO36_4453 [Myxococcales bacterium]|nr:hypothetical protein [Myxococcales bacterium]